MDDNTNNNNDLQYVFSGTGLTGSEKKWGKSRFEDYRNRYHIESLSDLQILEELVFREALQEKYKKKIGKITKEPKESKTKDGDKKPKVKSNVIPTHLLRAMDENLEKMLMLKEKLGLFGNVEVQDGYKSVQQLRKKFKKWMGENQGSRTATCPHCSKMILFKIRTTAWELLKHPHFKDKILANKHLWKMHKEGKITKDDIAKTLGCSTDYVDWLERKIYLTAPDKPSDTAPESPSK